MFVGTFIVSLNMYGFQLSVIDATNNPEWINYIDEETSAFAWPGNHMSIKPAEERKSKNIKIPNLDDIDTKVKKKKLNAIFSDIKTIMYLYYVYTN